jgi:hypothetical protein
LSPTQLFGHEYDCQQVAPPNDICCLTYSSIPYYSFLDAFAELRIATINFVMYVRLSIRMEQLGSHWTDFHEI